MNNGRYVTWTKQSLSEKGFLRSRRVPARSTLFVCIGSTIGKTSQTSRDAVTNQQINSVVPSSDYDADFVYLALNKISERIAGLAGKQAVPMVSKTDFSKNKLFVPNRQEQEKIAEFLTVYDEILAVMDKKLQLLTQYKKAIMQKIFTQQVRFKDERNNPYPKWQAVELSRLFKKYTDTIHVDDAQVYSQVTISKTGKILTRGLKKGDQIGRKRQFVINLKDYPNTLTFIRQGVFDGAIGFVPLELNGYIVTENMPLLSMNTSLVSRIYFTQFIRTTAYLRDVIFPVKPVGSAQTALHEKEWLKQSIWLPALAEQENIANFLLSLDNKIKAEEDRLTAAKNFKMALLQRMFV